MGAPQNGSAQEPVCYLCLAKPPLLSSRHIYLLSIFQYFNFHKRVQKTALSLAMVYGFGGSHGIGHPSACNITALCADANHTKPEVRKKKKGQNTKANGRMTLWLT